MNNSQSNAAEHRTGTFQVRPAIEQDLDTLTAIWFEGWHEAHGTIVPDALTRLRTLDNFRDRLRTELNAVRVIGPAGSPLGFTMLRHDELYQFYVAASARGRGISAVLMRDAEGQIAAEGFTLAWLACAVGNHRAARFYEKCGWHNAGTVTVESETSEGPYPLRVWRYEKRFDPMREC